MGPFRQALGAILFAATAALPAGLASANDTTDCHTGDEAKLRDPNFYDIAVQACTRLIAANSSNAFAYSARSCWLWRLKRYDEALADVDTALSIDPRNVYFYDAQADIWLAKGDLDRAIASYDQAIRIDPTYAAAYTSRGETYEKKGDFERARASYNAALATAKTRAGDTTGFQEWAHRTAETRLQNLKAPTR